MTAMRNPPHPGETVRHDCIEASDLSVTEAARLLGCSRPALSRLLNGRAGISPEMALALERQGWSNADFWMRLQAAYGLAQARRRAPTRHSTRRLRPTTPAPTRRPDDPRGGTAPATAPRSPLKGPPNRSSPTPTSHPRVTGTRSGTRNPSRQSAPHRPRACRRSLPA